MGLLHKRANLLSITLDSLEDQEGGAMYISCDVVSNSGPVEPEMGYVPNNSLFGLVLGSPQRVCSASCVGCLSCQSNNALHISSLASSEFDCGSCFDTTVGELEAAHISSTTSSNLENSHTNGISCVDIIGNSSYWSTEEMASTISGIPPLDIDPLPSLFPFSPCGASYNFSANPQQASISYTVHPHQMLVSPSSHHHLQQPQAQVAQHQQLLQQASHGSHGLQTTSSQCYYESGATKSITTGGYNQSSVLSSSAGHHSTAAIYPSHMSVNVSMNMTMHGYHGTDGSGVQCSQMNWAPQNTSSSVNVLYSPTISPSQYPGAGTYSFTADIRTPNINENNQIGTVLPSLTGGASVSSATSAQPPHSRTLFSSSGGQQIERSTSSPSNSPSYIIGGGGAFEEEDDSNDEGSSDMKPNLCRLCGKTYARPSTLKTHLRTHSGERPYRCPDCNKSFSQAANLTAHLRTHTGQKPFRCPICDRRFSQSSSVTTHMRTHSGERPYRCPSCKKSFSDSSTLTKHLRIHSGEKPYQCKLCLLRFSQSGNLNRHMRVHGTNNSSTNNNLIT